MTDVLLRFLIGGTVVSVFAIFGDTFRPRSFAGLFGAAPSVALATIDLTIAHNGRLYAANEALTMLAGVAAFFVYAALSSYVLKRRRLSALAATLALSPVWFAVAFGLEWLLWGKG